MEKKHISIWIDEKQLRECDANRKILDCKSRSDFIEQAVTFYNAYLHDKNNKAYMNRTLNNTLQGMMDSFERRMSRQMFKQAVEISKVFWLMVRAFHLEPESVDELHTDCVEEVKRINGAILFPFRRSDEAT